MTSLADLCTAEGMDAFVDDVVDRVKRRLDQDAPRTLPSITLQQPKLTDEEVWLRIYCAVASSSNVAEGRIAAEWANTGLERFKERFRSY